MKEMLILDDYNQKIIRGGSIGTITPQYGNKALRHGSKIIEIMAKKYRIRKLTPRECFRLMGVSDSDIDKIMSCDENGKRFISDSKCYQLAGNSIVVDTMVNGIFKNLFLDDDEPKDTLF